MSKRRKEIKRRNLSADIALNCLFAVFTILPILFLRKESVFAVAFLAVLSLVALYYWDSRSTKIVFLVGFLSGVTAEAIAISFGVWRYARPDVLGVPFWLFLVWGNAAVFIYRAGILAKSVRS